MDVNNATRAEGQIAPKASKKAFSKGIVELQEQVDSLRLRRSALRTALVEAQTSKGTVGQQTSSSAQVVRSWAAKGRSDARGLRDGAAFGYTKARAKHDQESLYRLAAGATMFEVKDPDPRAVDGGRVFGIRIDVCVGGKFLTPYYLLLHRPVARTPLLRIYKHTIPACIPLAPLATRYLPLPPRKSLGIRNEPNIPLPRQDLPSLVRSVRHELTAYHLRLASIEWVRERLIGGRDRRMSDVDSPEGVTEFAAVDMEGREVKITWDDKTTAKVRIGTSGDIQNCVVFGPGGRDGALERVISGGDGRIEGLAERLKDRLNI